MDRVSLCLGRDRKQGKDGNETSIFQYPEKMGYPQEAVSNSQSLIYKLSFQINPSFPLILYLWATERVSAHFQRVALSLTSSTMRSP
jgi:hypothetical protein